MKAKHGFSARLLQVAKHVFYDPKPLFGPDLLPKVPSLDSSAANLSAISESVPILYANTYNS
jgi:hypothetical protein